MKANFLFIVAILSFTSFGASPTYLKNVKGYIVHSLTEKEPFDLVPGELGKCERTEVGDSVHYVCDVNKATLTIGSATRISLDKVWISFRPPREGLAAREYAFSGSWSEEAPSARLRSRVGLVLWLSDTEALRVSGFLNLSEYQIRQPVEGRQERE